MDWRMYFLRHGIAANQAVDGSYNDALRPLTEKGRHRTSLVVCALKRIGGQVDIIFHSPLLRAQQTAQIAADELGVDRMQEISELLPERSPFDLEDVLTQMRKPGENVMMVGHQPHMSHALAWAISANNTAMLDMDTAGLASVRFAGQSYHGPGVLEWLMTPRWVSFMFPDEKW
ncbi:MAG TPA: phosphohistidine phosphatase SixA [Bacteroidetes bacterium]|nr:phosphohistidine phosphatase SixA [bacterium BMS3Bbin04]HDO65191.1 phosphohistidine phosphatase SixA [Bacteroidota bacterium]HEX04316.1 phosphohistidine phosphatase SixA [Bacteroidota bacterium]